MSQAQVSIDLSSRSAWALHSAANEATIHYDDERQQGGAPPRELSKHLSEAISEQMQELGAVSYTLTFTASHLSAVRTLIPACLIVHDANDLAVRTMETAESMAAAQAELLAALAPYDT